MAADKDEQAQQRCRDCDQPSDRLDEYGFCPYCAADWKEQREKVAKMKRQLDCLRC